MRESLEFLEGASINNGKHVRIEASMYGMSIDEVNGDFFADLSRDQMTQIRDMLDRVLEQPLPYSVSGVLYDSDED